MQCTYQALHFDSNIFEVDVVAQQLISLPTFPTRLHVWLDMMFLIIASSRFVEEVVAVTWFVDPSYVEKGMFDLPCCFKGSLYAG